MCTHNNLRKIDGAYLCSWCRKKFFVQEVKDG